MTFTLPDLQRQPAPALRALQDRLLAQMVEVCYRAHPFYRGLMQRTGLEPRHLQSCDDLIRLPITTKADFLADPEAFRLRGDDLPDADTTVWKVIYTTGTTSGRPAPIYVTATDFYNYLYVCQRQKEMTGLCASDVIANVFPLTPFPMGAYGRAFDEAAAVGASIVCAHTGRDASVFPVHRSLDEAVRMAELHRATVLWGVASFVRRMLIRGAELDADLRSVRAVMITGEASSRAMRDDLRRRMREMGCAGEQVVNRYGSTEQGASMVECQEGSGFHSLAPDTAFHEVVDPASGQRIAEGDSGALVFTHLMRRGTAFLRYQVGDIASMSTAPCPHCGRTTPRITSQPVRSGDIVKIKGTLVNLQVLKDLLERLPQVDEYQIVVQPIDKADPLSMDELVIRLAEKAGSAPVSAEVIGERVADLIHLHPRIEVAHRDEIFDPLKGVKPQRVVDLRPMRD